MLGLADFEVIHSSEVGIDSYIGGLDWLTVVCGPREGKRRVRLTLRDDIAVPPPIPRLRGNHRSVIGNLLLFQETAARIDRKALR
jgi:hypothetical protein